MGKSVPVLINELYKDCGLDAYRLKIAFESGRITLSGAVDSWNQVVLAGQLAGSLAFVDSVVNTITSPDADPPTAPPLPGKDPEAIETADIVIIGAGVVGTAIARELSRFQLHIILLEKEADVGCGASKANNGMVHSGIVQEPDSIRSSLNVRGNRLFEQVCRELEVPFNRCGMLTVIFKDEELFLLELIKARGEASGIPVEIISREKALKIEPSLNRNIKGAFLAPSTAMTSPYQLTIAYAENAVSNGVKLYLQTSVTGFEEKNGRLSRVLTTKGAIKARCCINAAGLYADQVAAMAGAAEFTIHPRKGELLIFDPAGSDEHPRLATAVLAIGENPYTKGGGTMITTGGNPEWGPTAVEVPDREDTSVTAAGIKRVLDKFSGLLPGFEPHSSIITFFSGLRAATYTEDFHIRPSQSLAGLINVAGIQSPGLAAAPAIAEMVIELVAAEGFDLKQTNHFNPNRKAIPRFRSLNNNHKNKIIMANPLYGHLVCRCEQVTEGEVVEAMRRPVPAVTLDSLKRRTRAGMGRCQGSFCLPRLALIMSRELSIPIEKLTKNGPGTPLFSRRTKTAGALAAEAENER